MPRLQIKPWVIITFVTIVVSCKSASNEKVHSDKAVMSPKMQLASWNDGEVKQSILNFIKNTTEENNPLFIPESDRIACFDNDGTLWCEQPMYIQLAFAIDQITAMAPDHPEWKNQEPYKSILEGDITSALAGGEHAIIELIMSSHANVTDAEFANAVRTWINTAKDPATGKLYKELVYKPMLELLNLLRANGYKTFIVSGGGVDFMRAFAEEVYSIPPYQVIGSSLKAKYEVINDTPLITKLPDVNFIDDKEGKPVAIYQYIGKRPVFCVGNSDGDYAMMQWTSTGDGARFGMFVHHTDSVREYAYDRDSHIGKLNKGLDDAAKYHWIIADMEKDWKEIY